MSIKFTNLTKDGYSTEFTVRNTIMEKTKEPTKLTEILKQKIQISFLNSRDCKFFNDMPVIVIVQCYFKVPKDMRTDKYRKLFRTEHVLCTKDVDAIKISELVCDALQGYAFTKRRQIVNFLIDKAWTFQEEDYMEIRISTGAGLSFQEQAEKVRGKKKK